MSLLDKLTGLAQKAKENVISKTFISKDKRLEHSLSDSIKVNDIFFQKMSTYGLPSVINVVAFDCVGGLLAVAGDSNHGYIKVFGKGISTTIKLANPSIGIKHLQFKTGFPILVVIDKSNHIITIDLRTKNIRHVLAAQEIITSQAYCTGTDWMFIGYANGYIDVFDIMQGTFTPYQIPDLLETQQQQQQQQEDGEEQEKVKNSHMVVDLQMHPNELNTLLVGYESTVYIWNIRENTIRKSFSLHRLVDKSSPYRNANLTCLAWSPNGSRFIGGYDDGCTHLWDIKNDQKPIASRRISQTFSHSSDGQTTTEPIYQIAWYANDQTQKSSIMVAGGSNPAIDIQGLNVLEYDLDSEARDPKKQSIMPLPTELSHFIILSTDPYHGGMLNPFGIAVVGVDHCLRAFSFDHAASPLRLPPALEFFGPNVLNACHIPQLPTTAFKKLAAFTTLDRKTKYFPITGGVAGPEHVYHVDSNDLLLTIHQGEVVKFWDASYTALRPLSHLTIHCLEELETRDAILCCLDVNKETGALTIGFSDGSIVVYECQIEQPEEPKMDPRLLAAKNQEFIGNCDDTLKEISDLLEDIGHDSDSEEQHRGDEANTNPFVETATPSLPVRQQQNQPPVPPPRPQQQHDDSTNPFVTTPSPTTNHQQVYQSPPLPTQQHHQQPDEAPELPCRKSSNIFKRLDKSGDTPGYYASLKISLNSPIKTAASVGESIIAVATDDGKVTVIDIYKQIVLFKHNITQSDFQNTVVIPAANLKSETATELREADPSAAVVAEVEKKPATITTLSFFNTYSPSKVMTTATQLFVGLSNGHVYQFNLALLVERGPSIAVTELMNDYLSLHVIPSTPLLDMFIVDLKGKSQLAIVEIQDTFSKESSHHSAESTSVVDENNEISSPKPSSIKSSTSSVASTGNVPSKRMAAIGKAEYRHQDNPHLIVCVSLTGISVVLSGFNVKLFSKEFKDFTVVRGEIVESHNGVCLCLIFSTGKLAFYALPTLDLMLEMNLPGNCLLDRLHEMSISRDGRIVYWSGKYEMEQYSFTPKPDFPIGESVILFDSQKAIPPHPSLIQQQQRPKKTWLDTVAGAFTREPLTLPELDLLMGRQPMEDPNVVRQQKIEAYKSKHSEPSGSSKGPGGVFSELGDKMNERGERLNELNQKFEDMNAASGDFLKSVKEYNDRQARKKWWEF